MTRVKSTKIGVPVAITNKNMGNREIFMEVTRFKAGTLIESRMGNFPNAVFDYRRVPLGEALQKTLKN